MPPLSLGNTQDCDRVVVVRASQLILEVVINGGAHDRD